jgi:hypothetical protein
MKHVSNVSTSFISATLIPYTLDFHCTLAISASYVDLFERKPGVSPKTLHHISQAYALVNLKLSGPESVSDSAITAVVSLAIYQQVHNLHSTGLIHLKGLYRMIQLRGGIARLMKENRALALKPLRYVHASAAFLPSFLFFFSCFFGSGESYDYQARRRVGIANRVAYSGFQRCNSTRERRLKRFSRYQRSAPQHYI